MNIAEKILPARLRQALATLVLALAAVPGIADTSTEFRPFDATYVGRISGAKVEVVSSLRQVPGNRTYIYKRSSTPRGFARMFRRHGVSECAEIDASADQLFPQLYDYLDGKGGGKSSRIKFDWERKTAQSSYKGADVELELAGHPIDQLSEELWVRSLLGAGSEIPDLGIIQRNGLHAVTYEFIATEKVDVAVGNYETVHLRRRRGNSSRTTDYWYARELNWLPVKIQRRRKGKSQGTATLKALNWIDPAARDQVRGSVTPVCP